ncbi:MAG: HesA/MoeB/ThiF family protein [Halobacteriales archaeon]
MAEPKLSATQLERYARQLVLDGFGAEAQGALRASSVLVVGAGGLGSPAAMYLAGAGVGTLGIADDDVVERSNLHRQVLHAEADVGRPKVDSAADWVEAHNPDVTVEAHETTVSPATAEALLSAYDLVVDASDRVPTRFLVNDTSALVGIPFVHGAVHRFEGQVVAFDPAGGGPCYRCLYPEAPPPEAVPDCATAGVLGPVPGVVGCLQAAQAIKLLAGVGEPALGRLLAVDTFRFNVDRIQVRANPSCPVCGPDASVDSLDDVRYEDRCRVESAD